MTPPSTPFNPAPVAPQVADAHGQWIGFHYFTWGTYLAPAGVSAGGPGAGYLVPYDEVPGDLRTRSIPFPHLKVAPGGEFNPVNWQNFFALAPPAQPSTPVSQSILDEILAGVNAIKAKLNA